MDMPPPAPTPIGAPNVPTTKTAIGRTATGAAPRDPGDERDPNQIAKAERRKAVGAPKQEERKKGQEPGASAVPAGLQGDFDSGINMTDTGEAARVVGTHLPRAVDRGDGSRMRSDTPTRND